MENNTNVFLMGHKVFLRAFEPGDEKMIAILENHPQTRETLFYALPTGTEYQLEKTKKQQNDPNTIVFTICDKETGIAIGQTAFVRIDWVGRMATFYIGIANAENRQKGLGRETVELMVEYAFNTLNLNRIHLHVAENNVAAIEVYKKCGFITEGKLREAMYRNGKYYDFYVMGILKSDFLKINQ